MSWGYKKRWDLRTAYGQLIVLVFLPICVLAGVGAILVFYETMRASRSEQKALAQATLMRYAPMVQQILPDLLAQSQDPLHHDHAKQSTTPLPNELYQMYAEQHLQRSAILSSDGQVLAVAGYGSEADWQAVFLSIKQADQLARQSLDQASSPADQSHSSKKLAIQFAKLPTNPLLTLKNPTHSHFISGVSTPIGTAYGLNLGIVEGQTIWFVVDMDNEPLTLARYRILLALVATGLFTLLMLLLSINGYAKRWIAPIYEMRIYLRKTTADTLHQPMSVQANGELNLLQQDLVQTLRRLHRSFQDLKSHAEQTESDLRLMFDEVEMQNISIRNARDLAVSASQAKSAFLANISHELRTPLNSIDGFANLLARRGNLTSEQDNFVQTICKSSAHLLALVNDVLDFSKIEAGKLVLDRHNFDLYDVVYDVADMLSPVAAQNGLRLAVLFYDDVPMQIVGDELRVKQVLTNLVGNAIKFTDTGDVVIRVSLDETKDNELLIAVQDSGRGVSEAGKKTLFQSFSQGDPSITRSYGGTGLGLVISKQLTRLMGGNIGFYDNMQESIANQGSTFWFSIPTQIDMQTAQTGEHIALPVLEPLSSNQTMFKILVWIQHSATLQVLKASLRPLPIELTQAHSLAGILDLLKEQGNLWHWVIVDGNQQEDMMALLKQIRLHYQGKLAIFGYQLNFDSGLLGRYQAHPLYEPLDKRQLYTLLDTQKSPSKPQNDTLKWQGITILAVDDHLPNLLVLEALLAELGITVLTANSGFDAIEIFSEHNLAQPSNGLNSPARQKIDLIFMDIQMPRMSGQEAAEQIRKLESNRPSTDMHTIPIIALTAHGMADERDKLIASGINDYVGKPISQPQLLQILQKWLGKTPILPPQITSPQHSELLDPNTHTPFLPNTTAPSKNPLDANSLQKIQDELNNLAVIDWEDALTRAANKPDLAAKLITMMIDTLEDEKNALNQAWTNRDRTALAQIAHRILGASRYTGVPQLRYASQNLEDKCLLNPQHTSAAQFSILAPSYHALQTALNNLKNHDLTPYPQLKYHRLEEDEMTWKMI